MSFREFVDQLKKGLHLDPLEPRSWACNPLLVIADADESVTYYGPANVEVTPRADGTADLVADVSIHDWHPTLRGATVKSHRGVMGVYSNQTNIGEGLTCVGADDDGAVYRWYVNGAALALGAKFLRDVQSGAQDSMPHRTRRPSDEAVG